VTGIDPDAVGQIKKNFVTAVNDGADPEMIEGDIFRTIVKVPEFGATVKRPAAPEVTRDAELEAQWRAQSGAQSVAIIRFLASRPLSARDLVDKLGLKSKTGALKRSLKELLDRGLAEYTIPGKPSSRLQKYRLTEKGRKAIEGIEGGNE
jgi:ATP-dependent DNA helicase RecG